VSRTLLLARERGLLTVVVVVVVVIDLYLGTYSNYISERKKVL
jgi:hypothetical protein